MRRISSNEKREEAWHMVVKGVERLREVENATGVSDSEASLMGKSLDLLKRKFPTIDPATTTWKQTKEVLRLYRVLEEIMAGYESSLLALLLIRADALQAHRLSQAMQALLEGKGRDEETRQAVTH